MNGHLSGILNAASQLFRIPKRIDHIMLSRCILGISGMRGLDAVFNQCSACLQELLDYGLFAVALQNNDQLHVWSVTNHGSADLHEKITNEFGQSKEAAMHVLASDIEEFCHLEDLKSLTLNNDAFTARLYWIAHEKASKKQRQLLDSIMRAMETAISNTLEMEKLRTEASFDRLTDTYGRREFDRIIEHSIANSQRYNRSLSIIMLDIDHFKGVNDCHGHLAGDTVLREIAKVLSGSIRKGDYLARYGGEEFIVILPETKMIRAIELAERLRKAIEAHRFIVSPGKALKVTASFGVSSLKYDSDKESLIKDADKMMYRAKTHGRNIVMPGVKLHGDPDHAASKMCGERVAMRTTPQTPLERIAHIPEL